MEKQAYDVAINWLKVRTLDSDPEGPWKNGAHYNLARCYEALGRIDEARQLYLIDDSPQRHGSLLRARQLEVAGTTSTRNACPVSRSKASMYFSRVLTTTSSGSAGGGLFLSQRDAGEPIPDELLVERRLAVPRLILVRRPEARAVRRHGLVDQNQFPFVPAPFELGVRDEDASACGRTLPPAGKSQCSAAAVPRPPPHP